MCIIMCNTTFKGKVAFSTPLMADQFWTFFCDLIDVGFDEKIFDPSSGKIFIVKNGENIATLWGPGNRVIGSIDTYFVTEVDFYWNGIHFKIN